MAKVSICIPTYQQLEFLGKNLESILIQDYEDYEVIITDDTPDNSVMDFIHKYKSRFKNKLSYFKNAKTLGSPENWNEAVRLANGKYIKILHHDDWFTKPYSLSRFVNALDSNPGSDFAFCAASVKVDKTGEGWIHRISNKALQKLGNDPAFLFFGNHVGAPSATIYRRNAHLTFDINLKWLVDLEFYIRVLQNNRKVVFLDEELIATIFRAEHNVTNQCENNKDLELFEYFYLYEKLGDVTNKNEFAYLRFFFKLINRYDVRDAKEIMDAGYSGRVPFQIKTYIFLRNIIMPC